MVNPNIKLVTSRPNAADSLPAHTPRAIVAFYDHWLSLPREGLVPTLQDYLDCVSACNKDPVLGVIGIQKGPL